VRERDHHVLRRDQVLDRDVLGDGDDLAFPRVGEGFLQRAQLIADHLGDARGLRQDVEEIGDLHHHLAVLVADLVLLEAREAAKLQVDDRLRLLV
jgi:hypothetical protein